MVHISTKGSRGLSRHWERVVRQSGAIAEKQASLARLRGESIMAYVSHHAGYEIMKRSLCDFHTGSSYIGQWNSLGMNGRGNYKFVHSKLNNLKLLLYVLRKHLPPLQLIVIIGLPCVYLLGLHLLSKITLLTPEMFSAYLEFVFIEIILLLPFIGLN